MRRTTVTLAAIGALALLVRLPLLPSRIVVEGDGVHYASLARDVLAGDLSGLGNPYWSNLWPGVIALTSAVTGLDVVASGRVASLLAGVLLPVCLAILGERVGGPAAGPLAGLAAALHPWLIHFSTLVFTESFFSLLTVAALGLGLRAAASSSARDAFAAGAVLALAIATRPEAFTTAAVVVILVAASWRRRLGWRLAGRALGLVVLPIVLVLGVRAGLVRYYYDEWDFAVGSKGTANLFIGMADTDAAKERVSSELDPQGRNRLSMDARTQGLLGFALRHPTVFGAHAFRNTKRLLAHAAEVLPVVPVSLGAGGLPPGWSRVAPVLAGSSLAVGLLGSIVALRRTETRTAAAALMAVLVLHAAGLAATNVHARLVVPLVPTFLVFFATGCQVLTRRIPILAPAGLVAAGLLSLIGLTRAPSLAYGDDPKVSLDAGRYVRARYGVEARLLTPVPAIAFYALDAEHKDQEVDLPWIAEAELAAYLRREDVSVVAAPEWYLDAVGHPSARALLSGTLAGLNHVATLGAPPYRVFLYDVEKPGAPPQGPP